MPVAWHFQQKQAFLFEEPYIIHISLPSASPCNFSRILVYVSSEMYQVKPIERIKSLFISNDIVGSLLTQLETIFHHLEENRCSQVL